MNQKHTPEEIAALQIAYEQAIYEVYFDRQTIQFRIGDRSVAIDFLLSKHSLNSWALITGYNPYSQSLPERENQQRHQRLIELVKSLHLAYLDAVGKDPRGIWTPELSLFILGIKKEAAIAIGQQFEQNAIVYGEPNKPAKLVWIAQLPAK